MTALSASVYAADPFHLAEEIEAVLANVESLHLDVMDGVFAPEYGLTARTIEALSESTPKPLDVHLMVAEPRQPAVRFSELGVRSIAIHVEATEDFKELSRIVRSNGSKAYAALRHTTPVAVLEKLADQLDGCLFLTAPAGGGAFDQHAFTRLAQRPAGLYTVVDGKIDPGHFKRLDQMQVDLAVVGAALFSAGDAEVRSEAFSRMLGESGSKERGVSDASPSSLRR
ncbi:MAG TPA: hypothetical protein VGN93_11235 [Shinella sp.]|jgi:ribulose-phosphate 3-epimerase|uniref:ribulose-phosphate 3-epimerase n=1 Tax=Shinella sp. TaxID=1870904 RepID=UPI0029A4AF60|nr:hypothetical protein [Shinella sp.]MDX3975538.1 hypothetical protein [Shinella sp.]HEV7247550.1 hypothetical protein [Shinella sp.]